MSDIGVISGWLMNTMEWLSVMGLSVILIVTALLLVVSGTIAVVLVVDRRQALRKRKQSPSEIGKKKEQPPSEIVQAETGEQASRNQTKPQGDAVQTVELPPSVTPEPQPKTPVGRHPPPRPVERGPHRGPKEPSDEKPKLMRRSALKPEIVCWEEGRNWIVGIEMPEQMQPLSVVQNNDTLESDSANETCYRLKRIEGDIKVTTETEKIRISVIKIGKNCLIFKMRRNWSGLGRLVRYPNIGYYLAVVPQAWQRDEEVSGHASINPESTQIHGYSAHFFYLDNSNRVIAFIASDGDRVKIESKRPRFGLIGTTITDDSEDMGPLFAGQPPCLRSLEKKGWTDVGIIVIGEEGRGKNKWRTSFFPNADAIEQPMPDELVGRGGGWYFSRIYNKNENLIESMDFRFLNVLKNVEISPYSFLPGPDGHTPVMLSFYHEQDCQINLIKAPEGVVEVKQEDHKTTAIIPNNQAWDLTYWELRSGKTKVLMEIMVERVRWSLVTMDEETPSEQRDKPYRVERSTFTATSKQALQIWLPKLNWTREVVVGFDPTTCRKFQVKATQRFVRIPLSDFSDASQISISTEQAELKIWIPTRDSRSDGVTICVIASKIETPSLPAITFVPPKVDPNQMRSCSTCDHARVRYETLFWCRRNNWPRVAREKFDKEFAAHVCSDWRGEYYDAEGNRHTS